MKSTVKLAAIAATLVVISGSAMAGPPGPPGGPIGGPIGGGPVGPPPPAPRGAPAPEIGVGIGGAAASIVLLGFMLHYRLRSRKVS